MSRKIVWPPRIIAHKSSGQDRCRFAGKYVYLGRSGSPESRECYARLLATHSAGQTVVKASPALTVAELSSAFLAHAGQEYSERGGEAEQYRIALRPLVRLFGSRPAASVVVADLLAYQGAVASGSWLTAEEKAEPARRGVVGHCRSNTNSQVNRVRRAWRWAEERGLVPPGSWAHLRSLRSIRKGSARARETGDVMPTTLEELARVLRHCKNAPVRAILRLMWATGARTGEACRIRPCEIDRTGEVWLYRPSEHKCEHLGHDRAIGLGLRSQRILAKWLAGRKGEPAPAPTDFLFPTCPQGPQGHREGCYNARSLSRRVSAAAKAAGVVDFWAYRLRHSFRRRAEQAGGLDLARIAMGHSTPSTTAGYARGADLKLIEEAARRLG